jgi:hypothetical protein
MSEKWYFWEVCVTVRKASLTVVTLLCSPAKSASVPDATTADRNAAAALLTLSLIMVALVTQSWCQPYVDHVSSERSLDYAASLVVILVF